MNPAYQGQLDVFCAAYAVINAMRHINATRLLTCRAILHEALLDAARDEESFCALLEQRTDYVDWVDAMLSRLEKQGSLLTARPFPTHFPGPSAPSPAVLWDAIADWLRRGERNAVLLQFVRILYPTEAVIRHWTCCNDVVGDISGIISGATGAAVVSMLVNDMRVSAVLTQLFITGLIAALTIGGKAFGKSIGIGFNHQIVFFVGKLIHFAKSLVHREER